MFDVEGKGACQKKSPHDVRRTTGMTFFASVLKEYSKKREDDAVKPSDSHPGG